MWGLGFGVWGFGFEACIGFRVWGSGFRALGLGFGVQWGEGGGGGWGGDLGLWLRWRWPLKNLEQGWCDLGSKAQRGGERLEICKGLIGFNRALDLQWLGLGVLRSYAPGLRSPV